MEWSSIELGTVTVEGTDGTGVIVNLTRSGQASARLTAAGIERLADRPKLELPELAPFVRTDLGRKKDRLAWPNGATAISTYAHLATWDHHAVVLDDRGFTVIDAEADQLVRLVADGFTWQFGNPVVHAGRLWIGTGARVVSIALADLEQLRTGPVKIALVPSYPLRRPDARLDCVYLWKLQSGKTMIEIGSGNGGAREPKLEIDLDLVLPKYHPLVLCDELTPNRYAVVEARPHPRQAIAKVGRPQTIEATVTRSRAKDPAAVAKAKAVTLPAADRLAEVERLALAIAAEPDDDGHRAVLADLLQELGDPTGELIAKLRSGAKVSAARQRAALGPLAPFLDDLEFRGGFPIAARLAREAPALDDHEELVLAAAADFRLGLIARLRTRSKDAPLYARFVGAPRATSLRHADAFHAHILEALVAANRDQLTHLYQLDFADKTAMDLLADATFDRVHTLHTVVGLAHLQPLMNRVIRDKSGVFERAPRHLVLEETRSRDTELLRSVHAWWPRLPIAALTIEGVTVERAGDHATVRATETAERGLVAAARKLFEARA